MEPIDPVLFKSRAAMARWMLSEDVRAVRKLLKKLMSLGLEGSEGASVFGALRALEVMYAKRRRTLPDGIDIDFARPWRDLLKGPDRERAFRAFEATTLSELRKALRNGSVWVPTSLAYRNRDQILMSSQHWTAHKKQYYKRLDVPAQPGSYVQRLIANVEVGFEVVAQAVRDGELSIDEEGLHIQALEAEEDPPQVASTKKALFRAIGTVQLPELLVAMDNQIRFSWVLLDRAPRSEYELLALYGALVAHGTELDAAGVSLMIPGLSEEAITDAITGGQPCATPL